MAFAGDQRHAAWNGTGIYLDSIQGIHIGSVLHHGVLVALVLDLHLAQMQELLQLTANGHNSLGIASVLCPKGFRGRFLRENGQG